MIAEENPGTTVSALIDEVTTLSTGVSNRVPGVARTTRRLVVANVDVVFAVFGDI